MPSETDASAQARRDLPDDVVRAQLERILASEVFSRSQQLRRFLSFIVEQSLNGQGHSLKESVLAHELYGRGTDFDGGTDPVVRVDARRLRDKLREYYQGRSDPVVISLPKGSYVPVFDANSASPVDTLQPVVLPGPQEARPITNHWRARIALGAFLLVALVATAVLGWRALRRPAAAPVQLLPLASYPGVEGPPALSPDGNLVAFAWSGDADGGPTDIYVKAVESEALRRLTQTPNSETSPAWSPDGHSIAFVRDGQGVFTMSQLGGAERQVSATGNQVAWGDSKSVLIRDGERNTGPFGIYQVSLDTLERRRLTQAPVGDGDWRFEVSPDGKSLAFIRYGKRGIADVYTCPWGVANRGGSRIGTPRFTGCRGRPMVGRLFTRSTSRQPVGCGASRDGAAPIQGRRLPTSPRRQGVRRSRDRGRGQPARLAFQTIARDVDLQLMDLGGAPGERHHRGRNLLEFELVSKVRASFARRQPDCVFAVIPHGGPGDLGRRRDGSGLQQVTSLDATGLVVGGWSPDGTRIVFDAAIAGNSDVYVVGADGGHLRRLTSEPSVDGVPSWSENGRWIDLSSTRAGVIADSWRVSTDGGEAGRLTHDGGFEPKESFDGRVPFLSQSIYPGLSVNRTAKLMRAPLAGGREELVRSSTLAVSGWSVTDTGIAFVTREPDFDAIERGTGSAISGLPEWAASGSGYRGSTRT